MTTPETFDEKSCLRLAVRIARGAARSLSFQHDREVTAEFDRDIKIRADLSLHSFIERELKKVSPFPVYSEEGNDSVGDVGNATCWIIDPLDGSLNFSRGIPLCAVSIALWRGLKPALGVVYEFTRDEMFAGLVGKGAWLNDQPIFVSKVKEKSDGVLCTGFPVGTDFTKERLLEVVDRIRSYKKVRWLGSAALSLAYVASGRADCYQEDDIALWDVAAGLALVEAAGGKIGYQPTKDVRRFLVRASNSYLL